MYVFMIESYYIYIYLYLFQHTGYSQTHIHMDGLYNEFIFHNYVGNPLEITVNFVVSLALCRNQAVGTNPTDVSFTRRVKHQS